MKWLELTKDKQITDSCISKEDWNAIVKSQPKYALDKIVLLDAQLQSRRFSSPGQALEKEYSDKLALASILAAGITWYDAALWCNALSAEFGLPHVYQLNGIEAEWCPVTSSAKGKLSLTEFEVSKDATGVRLLTEKEYSAAIKLEGFAYIDGLYEWGQDRRRSAYTFESITLSGSVAILCNSTFALPWNSFRVVRG
jgi:hypothetical protein